MSPRWLQPRALPRLGALLATRVPPPPLAMAFLAALALHLLALTGLQLRHSRRPLPAPPLPRDDSAELLQFSRQQMREAALPPLALPPLAPLPPPPPAGPSAPTSGPQPEQKSSPHAPGRSVGRPDLRPPPSARPRSTPKGARTASRGRRSPAATRQRTAPSPAPGLELALVALASLQSSTGPGPGPAAEAGWPLQRPQGEEIALWSRLWDRATTAAAATAATAVAPLPAGAQLRRLPLAEARAIGLSEARRQALLLGERLWLVWPQAHQMWLLQAPSRPPQAGEQDQGSD